MAIGAVALGKPGVETAPTVQTAVLLLVIVGAMLAFVVAVTLKLLRSGQLAGAPVKLTVGAASVAVVVCVAVAARKVVSAAQLAVSVQVPVPLVMVTVAVALAGVPPTGPTVQTPAGVMVGMVLALVVAVTVNVVLYAALPGAPANVTEGGSKVAVGEAMLDHPEATGNDW